MADTGRRRDFVGYGRQLPAGNWANGARIVVNIAVNYEEGAERSLLDGDRRPELGGEVQYPMPDDIRNLAAESNFEYGSRVGVWRLLDIFQQHEVTTTFLACGRALERNPALGPVLAELGHEPCSHGYRWGEHFRMDEAEERLEIQRAIAAIEQQVGVRPVGWYCRFAASERTRRLLVEEGGFLYDSDAYNDDLPYYVGVGGTPWLVVPYAMDTNDGRFASAPGYSTAEQFYGYLVASFDQLYAEGSGVPKLMSVGLHCRISGRPGRATAIKRFIKYAKQHENVWFATREQVARAWRAAHPPISQGQQ